MCRGWICPAQCRSAAEVPAQCVYVGGRGRGAITTHHAHGAQEPVTAHVAFIMRHHHTCFQRKPDIFAVVWRSLTPFLIRACSSQGVQGTTTKAVHAHGQPARV
eukprot:359469-Chlamydomonas_euryale.AAC.16